MREQEITRVLCKKIRKVLEENNFSFRKLQEIRLRIGKPLIVIVDNEEWVMRTIVEKKDLYETLEYISNYSLYAFENEMRQGFITIEGGHRVGITGQVLLEDGKVKNIRHVSSLNIRVSHEVLNCANIVFPHITENKKILNTLIISPPRCGKTTLLRDMIRQISDGNSWVDGCSVGVVDERSELGGAYLGVPQNQLGIRTDVLDCCPKAEGMLMLVRSMAPQVIAVDEIGCEKDISSLEYAMHCGCKMIASVHGTTMQEILEKPMLGKIVETQQFKRYIILTNVKKIGGIQGIYNERLEEIYCKEGTCKKY